MHAEGDSDQACGGPLAHAAHSAAHGTLLARPRLTLGRVAGGPGAPLLVIRAETSDRQGQPVSAATALSQATFANDFYASQSYGAFEYPSIEVTPLVRLVKTAAYYEALPWPYGVLEALVDGKAAAERAGFVLDDYAGFVLHHPPFAGWSAGVGPPGGALISGQGYPLLVAHELGHTVFSFPHAGVAGDPTGDHYDVMGYAPRIEPQTVNVCFKHRAGWIDDAHVHHVVASGTYRIQAHSEEPLTASRLAIRLRKDDTTDYWVEFRQDLPSDPAVANGVVIHTCPVGLMSQATPGSELVAIRTLGNSFTDAGAALTITPLAKGGTSPETIDVQVTIGPGTPPPAPLTVTTPNGGDAWVAGAPATVTWVTNGGVGNVAIDLSINGGASFTTLVASTANDGSESVTPSVTCTQCRIRVRETDGSPSDVSNASFVVLAPPAAPALNVLSPNGGETWPAGAGRTITWDSMGPVGNVALELSTNGGASWSTLVPLTADDGSEAIVVPNVASNACLVRVRDVHQATVADTSNASFTITPSGPTPTPGPTATPAGVTGIRATSMMLRDGTAAGDPTRRRLAFRSATYRGSPSGVVPPAPGSAADPSLSGATLLLYNASGSGEKATVALPASLWSRFGNPSGRWGWRYADPLRVSGPVSSVKLDSKGTFTIAARGATLAYTLDEPLQGSLALRLDLGGAAAMCALSPARTSGNPPSTAASDRVDRFVGAPNAPPPAMCPAVP